ncbi:hypothetical protein MBANPS3_001632 [Mucor bainieri]
MDHQYQAIYYNHNNANSRLPLTPNNSNSPPSVVDPRECPPHLSASKDTNEHGSNSDTLHDYPQEITWLFFRDNKWVPFQSNNHYKIEQAFTLGDLNFPHLKSIRVFPTRMYLSYLGMKYRLSCVIQG